MRYALNSADTAFATMIAPVTTASGGGRHTPTEAHHGTGSEPSPDATRHFVELAQEACFERAALSADLQNWANERHWNPVAASELAKHVTPLR